MYEITFSKSDTCQKLQLIKMINANIDRCQKLTVIENDRRKN